ncbi:MAG: lmo0937 family membrane protein [Gemmatimonadota bacterium]
MIWTIIVVLLILWLLGAFVRPVGGFIHLLLVIVLVLAILQLL